MARSDSNSIVHRKTRFGREDFDARAMSTAKALRLSLAKTADTMFDLPLTVSTVEQSRVMAQAIPDSLNEEGLLIVLDGAAGARGAVRLDPQLIAALIEVQITGAVRPSEARARTYTRTDAAMASEFLDRVLDGFDAHLLEHADGHRPLELRFGDLIEDARVLALTLDDGQFDLFRITVTLAEGAKTGLISFVLPHRATAKAPGRVPAAPKTETPLAATVLQATAVLDTVLARLDMPLGEVCALKPGMLLPLPNDSLSETRLYAPHGHMVAAVRLGQLNGQRAVRLVSAEQLPEPEETATAGQARDTPSPVQTNTATEGLSTPAPISEAGATGDRPLADKAAPLVAQNA